MIDPLTLAGVLVGRWLYKQMSGRGTETCAVCNRPLSQYYTSNCCGTKVCPSCAPSTHNCPTCRKPVR